jgi:tripartite-type tricarboxylate transporter receptor subunit TctC
MLAIGPRVPVSVKSLSDFVLWCRQNPQLATYGAAGPGTHPHFLGATLGRAAAFDFVYVPYKGGIAAVQDVMGSHLAACIGRKVFERPVAQAAKDVRKQSQMVHSG